MLRKRTSARRGGGAPLTSVAARARGRTGIARKARASGGSACVGRREVGITDPVRNSGAGDLCIAK